MEDKEFLLEQINEKLEGFTFSWRYFFIVAAFLLISYTLLRLLKRYLAIGNLFGKYQKGIESTVYNILLVYEPMVVLILTSIFVMINPAFHGLIVLMLVIFGFTHIRSYFNGRVILFNDAVKTDREIKTNKLQGIIAKKERLGLQIKTLEGVHFVRYSDLVRDGYMLLSGEDISGFYELIIQPKAFDDKLNYIQELTDQLAVVPYLDWTHKPEITIEENQKIKARIVVKDDNHVNDLIALINDWDYSCKILKT